MRRLFWILGAAALLFGLFLVVRGQPGRARQTTPAATASASATRPSSPARRSALPGLVVVRGRVISAEGRPVQRAEVRVFREPVDTESPMAEVETDRSGAFEALVPPSKLEVTAVAPGFVAGTVPAEAPGDPILITLLAGATLRGRVVRAGSGEPVPGAVVDSGAERWESTTTIADGAGRFRFSELRADGFRPVARAEALYGQAPLRVWVDGGGTSEEITIAVHPVASLRGRLELADTAAPCPEGTVKLVGLEVLSATANAAGDVLFPALLPGRYAISLTCPGHGAGEQAPAIEVGEQALTARFVVHDRLAIMGVVEDEEGASAGPEITVQARRLSDPPEDSTQTATTDDEGRFDLRPVQPGTYELTATSGGPPLGERLVVTVVEGVATPNVRLRVGALHRIAGQVVDEQGRPAANLSLYAQADGERWSVDLDEDGRFELGRLPSGRLRLGLEMLGAPLAAHGDAELTVPVDHPVRLVAELPEGRIEGQVVGGGPWQGPPPPVDLRCQSAQTRLVGRLSTNAEGRFSLRVPQDTECLLTAESDRGEAARVAAVKAGAWVELRLRPPATLQGRLKGAPRVFRVLVNAGREEVFFATDGAWEMRGVPPGVLHVGVTAAGLVGRAEVTIEPGEIRTIDVPLRPDGRSNRPR